jgi:SH3-like domain-containing protein
MAYIRLLLALVTVIYTSSALAKSESLPIPRFVSIKSSEANIRTGPNVRYPVKWVFVRKGEPVEVITEFEQWRKIRDKQGDDGWIHESMLSGKRQVILIGDKSHLIYKKADMTSPPLVKLEPEVRAELHGCHKEWCRIESSGYKGWVERKFLWGVYNKEEIE